MRSPRMFLRIQSNQYTRTLVLMLLMMCATVAVLVVFPSSETTILSYNSWHNVSVYQLVKMHLSGRPSHVTSMSQSECRALSDPEVNQTLLNYDQVQYYEDVVVKMKHMNETDHWKTAFHPMLNRTSKMSLMHLYSVFKDSLDGVKVSHILMHGSAIGAWRHHGVTPWDDDIDIAIDASDWLKARNALSCIKGYALDAASNSKWAFYKRDSPLIQGGPKRWPFLDLFLYTSDDNYVWALNYVHLRKFVFPREDMLPVQYVPFECFMVPVPRHLRKVLEHQYIHPEICTSHYVDHRSGEALEPISKPCKGLSDMYKIYDTYN